MRGAGSQTLHCPMEVGRELKGCDNQRTRYKAHLINILYYCIFCILPPEDLDLFLVCHLSDTTFCKIYLIDSIEALDSLKLH